MAELPVPDAEEFVIWMLKEYRKNNATVMVAPGDGFYATPGRGKNEIRFAYVLETGALSQAMEILAGALEAYPVKARSRSLREERLDPFARGVEQGPREDPGQSVPAAVTRSTTASVTGTRIGGSVSCGSRMYMSTMTRR